MRRTKGDEAVEANLEQMSQVVSDSGGDPDRPHTRRQLLRLATGAAIGGGLVLAGADPAAAADGGPLLMGEPANDSEGQLTGLNSGIATGSLTVGTSGMSNTHAIVGAANGTGADLKLAGTGRLGFSVDVSTGNAAPSGSLTLDSIGMSSTGVLWAGKSSNDTWRRINAVRVDNPNGNGTAFSPFRLVNTLNGTGLTAGKKTVGTTHTVNAAGHANLPDDTIAIFGNLAVVGSTYNDGYIKLYPAGVAEPSTSAINFNANQTVANFFFLGLGTSGGNLGRFIAKIGKSTAGSGSVHVVIDVTAYVQ